MKQVRGIWLPDDEQHLVPLLEKAELVDGFPGYQYSKLERSLRWVKDWMVAVDVGAHCGLWSLPLSFKFHTVIAFEPVPSHGDCWQKNLEGRTATLHRCALGAAPGEVAIVEKHGSSGDAMVAEGGGIPMRTLDSFDYQNIDYLKLDCNGYELNALRGAEQTLKRCHPVVCVEQKFGRAQRFGLHETGAVEYLTGLGAVVRDCMNGVYVLSWEG